MGSLLNHTKYRTWFFIPVSNSHGVYGAVENRMPERSGREIQHNSDPPQSIDAALH